MSDTPTRGLPMRPSLASSWWALTIRGIVAILFGVLTFFWPAITLTVLALVFGAYAPIDGSFKIVAAFRGGRVTFPRPGITGLFGFAPAIQLPKYLTGEWLAGLG